MDARELLDSLDVGVAAIAPDWTIVEWSFSAARITGLPADRVLGQSFWVAFPIAKGEHVERFFHDVLQDGVARSFVSPGRAPELAGKVFETRASRGPRSHLILEFREVRSEVSPESQAAQLLTAFETERRLYRQLFESLLIPALMLTLDGQILEVNREGSALLGLPDPRAARGQALSVWLPPVQHQALAGALRDAIRTPQRLALAIDFAGEPAREVVAMLTRVDPDQADKVLFLALDVSREALPQQLLLQQRLPRHVEREEQHFVGLVRVHASEHGHHLARRLAGEVDGEGQPLRRPNGVPQRTGERLVLHRGQPDAQGLPARRARVGKPEQGAAFTVDLQNLAIEGEHEGRDGQGLEQLAVQPPLGFECRQELGRLGLGRHLRANLAELQDQVAARAAAGAGLEYLPGQLGRAAGRDEAARDAVLQNVVKEALHVLALGDRKRDPEALAEDAVGGQPGDAGGGEAPLHDRPVGGDRRPADVKAIEQLSGVHTAVLLMPVTQNPVGPNRGRNGAGNNAWLVRSLYHHGCVGVPKSRGKSPVAWSPPQPGSDRSHQSLGHRGASYPRTPVAHAVLVRCLLYFPLGLLQLGVVDLVSHVPSGGRLGRVGAAAQQEPGEEEQEDAEDDQWNGHLFTAVRLCVRSRSLHIQVSHELRVLFDEPAARLDFVAHERLEQLRGLERVLHGHLQERALVGVHRRVAQLVGVHLAQALVALDDDIGGRLGAVGEALDVAVPLLFGVGVVDFLALGYAVQRRLRDVDVAGVDQLLHFLIEEGEEQRPDVRAVHVGVGHDDDLVIPRVLDLEVLAHAGADGGDHGPDLLVGEDLVDPGFLYVEDLAAQWQDGLELAHARHLGRSTRRIALDQEHLAQIRVVEGAVGELAGQQTPVQPALLAHQLARLAGRLASPRRADRLRDDRAGHTRVLVEELAERIVHHALDDALDLGVAQLGLGLPLELGGFHLHVQHAVQPLTHVVAREGALLFLEEAVLFRPLVDGAGEGRLEAREVRPAFVRVDVVDERERVLAVLVVVLDRALDLYALAGGLEHDRLRVQP